MCRCQMPKKVYWPGSGSDLFGHCLGCRCCLGLSGDKTCSFGDLENAITSHAPTPCQNPLVPTLSFVFFPDRLLRILKMHRFCPTARNIIFTVLRKQ